MMAHENAAHEQGHETHFWVDCPGCGYGGKIGVPAEYPADVVVCPKCRQVVRVRPEDRILWQPADAMEFLRRRFPGVDWEANVGVADGDRQPHPQAGTRAVPHRKAAASQPRATARQPHPQAGTRAVPHAQARDQPTRPYLD